MIIVITIKARAEHAVDEHDDDDDDDQSDVTHKVRSFYSYQYDEMDG